jgi:glutamine amidotransferase
MIAIINYGMGNLRSVEKAFFRIGKQAVITSEWNDIVSASHIVLPGVGHFKAAMEKLYQFDWIEKLTDIVILKKKPILGICLGMQLMTDFSEEGHAAGLGWVEADTIKFQVDLNSKLRIPHMGWNNLNIIGSNFLDMANKEPYFYFVHSYYVKCKNNSDILATTHYGNEFVSAFRKDNIIGVQFHPEKSHKDGLNLLKNFSEINTHV